MNKVQKLTFWHNINSSRFSAAEFRVTSISAYVRKIHKGSVSYITAVSTERVRVHEMTVSE